MTVPGVPIRDRHRQITRRPCEHTRHSRRPVRVSGNKITRAEMLAARAGKGDVALLHGDWNDAFLDEAALFPDGTHDDQVDAVVGALTTLAQQRREPELDPHFYGEILDSLATDSYWFGGDDEIDNGFW